jgi:hypothetical protein
MRELTIIAHFLEHDKNFSKICYFVDIYENNKQITSFGHNLEEKICGFLKGVEYVDGERPVVKYKNIADCYWTENNK